MKNIKNLLALFLFISLPINSQIIDKINISGLSKIDRGTVLAYIPIEVGDFYSNSRKQELTSSLIRTGFFHDVVISDDKNNLNIEVFENPSIKEIVINMDTNNLIELDKIKENLDSFEISKGKIYNEIVVEKFISQIKKVYKLGGYSDAVVSYKTNITTNTNLATIYLNIIENEIVKIHSMKVSGNKNFKEEDLLDLFTIGEADNFLFNFFTKKDDFSRVALDSGIDKLTNFYLNQGYLDISIDKVDKKGKNNINITIYITEGPLYKTGNIEFSKDIGVSVKTLKNLLKVKTGDIFNRSGIMDGIQKITDFLSDKGYAYTKVDPKISKNIIENNHFVNLFISINKNQKVYINRVTIDGNTRTSDEVIRREIGVLEGGLYSNTKVKQSIDKLKRLGFFSNVAMRVSKVSGVNDRINLHFSVIENKTGQFSIGASHANSTGIAFNVGVKEKNIFGTGNELNASLAYSKAVKSFNLYFLDPYFTVDGHSISYGVFHKTTDGGELTGSDAEQQSYTTDKTGVSLGYGIPINEDSKVNAGLKLSVIDVSCGSQFSGVNYESKQCANNYNNEVYFNAGYTLNTLNNFIFPTVGNKASLRAGIGLPIADYRYYKIDANYKKYIPLSNNLTLKLNTNIGYADGYSDRELPFFERYHGGGSSSVRGFKFNSLGDKYTNNKSKGGKSSMLGSVSIISPLSWVKDSSNMRIAAFIDAGGISGSNDSSIDFRASTGIGFVWMTPIGPLGLYSSKAIKKEDTDDTKSFEFTLGTSF
jgi:outer membrane protein insertion porin family